MNLTIVFPHTTLNDICFVAQPDSLVDDVILAISSIWPVDAGRIGLVYSGKLLPVGTRILSHGMLQHDGELVAMKRENVIGRAELLDKEGRAKIESYYHSNPHQRCYLDASSMCTELGTLITGEDLLPSSVKHVSFINTGCVQQIGDDFLVGCTEMQTIDLAPLCNVSRIGYSFLNRCPSIVELDLAAFSNITTVGNWFLGGCTSLTSIDLSPLSKVVTLGQGFLYRCTGLSSLDLSPLKDISTIGDFFLYSCNALSQLDLSSLGNVTSVGSHFLELGHTNAITEEGKKRFISRVKRKGELQQNQRCANLQRGNNSLSGISRGAIY
eukprot:TRINITY_DN2609_c2_g1_i1.p1 TRINITY_DN2609_c2_g1~~TRINITY_DN2609_c2_g1_i1.p1  ORF type:complete len:326 (+),score=57.65 TRINITY_DN2609_c2_g1_i1:122-1099(+)